MPCTTSGGRLSSTVVSSRHFDTDYGLIEGAYVDGGDGKDGGTGRGCGQRDVVLVGPEGHGDEHDLQSLHDHTFEREGEGVPVADQGALVS